MTWEDILREEREKPYFKTLTHKLNNAKRIAPAFPREQHLFRALELTPFHKVKVIIVGHAPYAKPGRADGLAFSSAYDETLSLRYIKIKIKEELGIANDSYGNTLESWAKQGVLLLNATWTSPTKRGESHVGFGWEHLTAAILRELYLDERPKVFISWGMLRTLPLAMFIPKQNLLEVEGKPFERNHLFILSETPDSPYFFKQDYFSFSNDFLIGNGISPIDWRI